MLKFITCAGAVFVLSSATTYAEDRVVTNAVVVSYADLDLSREAGAEAMLHRITTAAREACGVAPDIREMQQRSDYDACVHQATSNAIDNLHAPLVAALARRPSASISVANR